MINQDEREFQNSLIWVKRHFPEEPIGDQVKMAEAVHTLTKQWFNDIIPKMAQTVEIETKKRMLAVNTPERLN